MEISLLALLYLVIATLFAAIGGMYIAALLGNTNSLWNLKSLEV